MGSLDPRSADDGCSLEPQPSTGSRSNAASKRALMHLRLQNNENETLEKLLNTPPQPLNIGLSALGASLMMSEQSPREEHSVSPDEVSDNDVSFEIHAIASRD